MTLAGSHGLVEPSLVTSPTAPNADQITHWNESSGPNWAELAELLDRQLSDVSARAMAALAPRAGERVLDVGCGCGRSTLDLARAVGPEGRAVGLDVSRPMLSVARARAEAAGLAHASFLEGDAQVYPLLAGGFDALFSSFGVMFFEDPTLAFANLRRALRPGGRLAFVCWRPAAENPVMTRAMAAARHRVPEQPPPVPNAPGPFAFGDAGRVRGILSDAGFSDVAMEAHDSEMGGNGLDDALTLSLRVGPLGSILRAHPELAPGVREDVRAALASCVRDGIVWQRSATWIVQARSD
jgi:SAM-dependent methyltransferase